MDRRKFLASAAAGAAYGLAGIGRSDGLMVEIPLPMETRRIPRTGQMLPVVGCGTYKVFDVALTDAKRQRLAGVMANFVGSGGTLVDSSPMYGKSESVVGELGKQHRLFRASKVWTRGKAAGIKSLARSAKRMGGKLDLAQVHNLVDWKTHLPVLREMRIRGDVRYVGVTDYRASAFPEIERIVASQDIDFVQIPYSLGRSGADKRLLDVCEAHRVAVIVLSPFEGGRLLRQFRSKKIPVWVQRDLKCTTWAQVLLKWIIGHPAVNCPIPATGKPKHMIDNMGAGTAPFPTPAQRKVIAKLL